MSKLKLNKVKLVDLEARYIPLLFALSTIFGFIFIASN